MFLFRKTPWNAILFQLSLFLVDRGTANVPVYVLYLMDAQLSIGARNDGVMLCGKGTEKYIYVV